MNLLSIITINYNNQEGLAKTMESIFSQTFKNIEYIIIDGNSNDGSVELIKQNNSKINYWISEDDKGIYNAQNKGILKATGDYLLFLNSGDYLSKDTILADALNYTFDKDFIYGDLYLDTGAAQFILEKFPDKLSFFYFFNNGYLPHPSAFIKRKLFSVIGFYNETFKIMSDWEFWLKAVFLHQASYKRIPLPVSVFNMDGISPNQKNISLIKSEKDITYKNYFSGFIDDYERCNSTEETIKTIDNNKIIKILKKLKLLKYSF